MRPSEGTCHVCVCNKQQIINDILNTTPLQTATELSPESERGQVWDWVGPQVGVGDSLRGMQHEDNGDKRRRDAF